MLRTRFALAQVIRSEQGARMPVTVQADRFCHALTSVDFAFVREIRSPNGFDRHAAPRNGSALERRLGVWRKPSPERGAEFANCPQDTLIYFNLSFIACLQAVLSNRQRMVASFDDIKFVRGTHFSADPLE
jgi:hypothetical protein